MLLIFDNIGPRRVESVIRNCILLKKHSLSTADIKNEKKKKINVIITRDSSDTDRYPPVLGTIFISAFRACAVYDIVGRLSIIKKQTKTKLFRWPLYAYPTFGEIIISGLLTINIHVHDRIHMIMFCGFFFFIKKLHRTYY